MKKLLLILCAFLASLTVGAQPTASPSAPTIDAAKVRTVFSATYGNAVGIAGVANTKETLADQSSVIKATGGMQYSIPFAPFSVNDMEYLHYDIWANEATTIAFSMYCTSAAWIGKQENLVVGWNAIDIPLSYFTSEPYNKSLSGDITELNLCKSLVNSLDGFNNFTGTEEFYIANIYFYTTGERYDAPTISVSATDITQTSLNLNLNATKSSRATSDVITYTITWNNGANTVSPNPTGTSGVVKVVPVDGLTANTNYTFHVVATDDHGDNAEMDLKIKTLQPDGIAPTTVTIPTYNSEDVISVYSSVYTNIYDALNADNQSQFDVDNGSKHVWKLSNFRNANIHFPDNYIAPTYDKLIIDVYSEHNSTICIYPEIWANEGGGTAKGTEFNLLENTWNQCVIDVQELLARTNRASSEGVRFYTIQFTGRLVNKVDDVNASDGFGVADGSNTIYIGNVYFLKETEVVETESITVTAPASEVAVGKTVQLTVKNQGNNTLDASTITFTSSDDTKATVDANGVVTGVAEGNVTITATLTGSNPVISNTINLTVTPAPAGLKLTADGHTILLNAYHYVADSRYELVITSEEVMTGLGGSFWNVNGNGTADMRSNMVVSQDGHTLTCSATSSSDPKIYTPLYVMMPGEVNFGSVTLDWQEIGEVSNEVVVTVSGNTALVTGAVSAADVATIVTKAGTAAVIDLTSATLSESITITPTNKNAIVVVDGTERTSEKIAQLGGTKNIVVYDGIYRRAADGCVITLVDDNASQPAYDFVIDAQKDGISYTRTIAAGAYASVNSPAPITIPNSLAIYKATDATTSEITFTKQSVGGIGANESVILHNPTGEAVVLTSEVAKTDLNLTANPGGATIGESGVTQFGTARAVAADGSQFALQGGELKQFNAGATIGAFRVYYTGLSSASPALAIFEDGEGTTAIKAIRNGEIVDGTVYDLQGRRVLNPTKGMYIINGKKVILK